MGREGSGVPRSLEAGADAAAPCPLGTSVDAPLGDGHRDRDLAKPRPASMYQHAPRTPTVWIHLCDLLVGGLGPVAHACYASSRQGALLPAPSVVYPGHPQGTEDRVEPLLLGVPSLWGHSQLLHLLRIMAWSANAL